MGYLETARSIREGFRDGRIPLDELLLHVEPILYEVALARADQDGARKIVDDIEEAMFTLPEPIRTARIDELLAVAVSFALAGQSRD